jgi:Leucine-rich repeat (LRR) protein
MHIDTYWLCACLQKLDISGCYLQSLPDELSSLQNLKELDLCGNHLVEPHVSVLRRLTALVKINLSNQDASATFRVPSSLLPILHPGLIYLDMRQQPFDYSTGQPRRIPWDELSLSHLRCALAEVADRRPVRRLLF